MRIKSLVRRWSAFTVLLLTFGFWAGLSAAPLPPPLLCVDGDDCVETPEVVPDPPAPPPSGDGYTLADATVGLPFTLNTPVAPTITSEATVTPATIQANKVNGRRLILQPGNYGSQTFGTLDQEIVIQPGVEIDTLNIDRTARRLHFRAEPARSGRIRNINTGGSWNNGMTDLMFDGINADDTGSPGTNQVHGIRVAVINSSITASAYAMGNFHEVTDFILANSHVHTYGTTQANMRSHSALRYVVVDSRLQKSGSGHHALRVHGASSGDRPADMIYIARNQFDGSRVAVRSDGMASENNATAQATAGIQNAWFVNNVIYQPGLNNASLYTGNLSHDSDRPVNFTVRDNVLYSDRAPFFSPGQPRANWDVANNSQAPYAGVPANSWDFQ